MDSSLVSGNLYFQFLGWLVSFRNPRDIWKNHPSYLFLECVVYLCAILTLVHAAKTGGRYIFLWLAILFHGFTVESVSYWAPEINNFWHAQSMVMFLGKRLPLHILALYLVFIYPASAAVSYMKLKFWAQPFAVGLGVVLIDLPLDITGIKQVWWTWHDTDPNIFDRMYWVPWTSYYFHAAFASSFTFLLHSLRYLITGNYQMYYCSSYFKELFCSILTGTFSMAIGILQFIPVYHPLHDLYGVHTQVCVLVFLSFFLFIVWKSDRNTQRNNSAKRPANKYLLALLAIFNVSMFLITLLCDTNEIRSIGLHEMTGPCEKRTPVQTPIGKVLSKRRFLCTSDYDEGYYDFHCLPSGKAPPNGVEWYPICGTHYANKVEYLVVVGVLGMLSFLIYHEILKTGVEKKVYIKNINKKNK